MWGLQPLNGQDCFGELNRKKFCEALMLHHTKSRSEGNDGFTRDRFCRVLPPIVLKKTAQTALFHTDSLIGSLLVSSEISNLIR
ncbi:unnamed protein product [Ilex paraguariensis]|uniref:Uncharacterized protein n=1 Tax=Ilex paraguariensis TaxID=185542 RepID=A0ABC8S030_9AQUA